MSQGGVGAGGRGGAPGGAAGARGAQNNGQQQQGGNAGGRGQGANRGGGVAGTAAPGRGYMSRILGTLCHGIRPSPQAQLDEAKLKVAGVERDLEKNRQKRPNIDWSQFQNGIASLADQLGRIDGASPDVSALDAIQSETDALSATLLTEVESLDEWERQVAEQEALSAPLKTLPALLAFLQNNTLSIGGYSAANGPVPFYMQEAGKLRPPVAGKPQAIQGFNFFMNPTKNLIDSNNDVTFLAGSGDIIAAKAPQFLTIPADTTDALVTTGQLTGCTIGAFKKPDGSLAIIHLQPRPDAERPPGARAPTGSDGKPKRPPPQPLGTPNVMTTAEHAAYLAAENAAMRKVVETYAAKAGDGTAAMFYQSDAGSGAGGLPAYDKEKFGSANIIGRVMTEGGVSALHLFAQLMPIDGSAPTVVEFFDIPLG